MIHKSTEKRESLEGCEENDIKIYDTVRNRTFHKLWDAQLILDEIGNRGAVPDSKMTVEYEKILDFTVGDLVEFKKENSK